METINTQRSKLDMPLWILVLVLTAMGVFANYYFSELMWALRFAGWILLICVLLGIIALTTQGKKVWVFAKSARMELLKVVWPKRDEVIKITMVIAGLVIVASIIMWGMDSILLWSVGWLTGRLI